MCRSAIAVVLFASFFVVSPADAGGKCRRRSYCTSPCRVSTPCCDQYCNYQSQNAPYIVRNTAGEPLVATEYTPSGVIHYFRNAADIDRLLSRICPSQPGVPTRDSLITSNCSSTSSGGCSGSCSTPYATCLGFKAMTIEGTVFVCQCR